MFADRFIQATDRFGPLCLGIDPHAGRIPDVFGGDTAEGILEWGKAILSVAQGRVGIVKPQVALFERHGWQGMRVLSQLATYATSLGFVVLMDAKRGDIGSTAAGYAAAYLGADAPFICDAVTVNPYMGVDTLEPFVEVALAQKKGVIVLARTSNPGSSDFQARDCEGLPLFARVVDALAPAMSRLEGESGWSGLMLVTGATGPEEAMHLRQRAPNALFLVPGYGAQGADAGAALASFVDGKGGCVNASRSLIFPNGHDAAVTRQAWADLIGTAISAAQDDLKSALTA